MLLGSFYSNTTTKIQNSNIVELIIIVTEVRKPEQTNTKHRRPDVRIKDCSVRDSAV